MLINFKMILCIFDFEWIEKNENRCFYFLSTNTFSQQIIALTWYHNKLKFWHFRSALLWENIYWKILQFLWKLRNSTNKRKLNVRKLLKNSIYIKSVLFFWLKTKSYDLNNFDFELFINISLIKISKCPICILLITELIISYF